MDKKEAKPEIKRKEGLGLILLSATLILFLSLWSYKPEEPHANWLGLVGYGIGFISFYLFGLVSYLLLFFVGWLGIRLLSHGQLPNTKSKIFYFSSLAFSLCILFNLLAEVGAPFPAALEHKVYNESIILEVPYPHVHVRHNLGGVPFYFLYRDLPTVNLEQLLSNVGTGITFSIIALVSLILFTETRIFALLEKIKHAAKWMRVMVKKFWHKDLELEEPKYSPEEIEQKLSAHFPRPIFPPKKETEAPAPAPVKRAPREPQEASEPSREFSKYRLPPPALLKNAKPVDQPTLKKDLRVQAQRLEETLLSFGIEAKVGEIHCGPTITSFEVHPAVGVKVQKIKTLENDIALNLQAKSIRIIAPIPGKAAVGVEIPSQVPQEVSFKELLVDYQKSNKKLQIPILLGKTVSGEHVLCDLTKMPHCIIAGATGSGKSVCINTLVISILMNARPDEIKLLLVDPKKVELTAYTSLPHMIAPVITEAHGAYAALNWLVKEMQLRYEILKQLGQRNIGSFNSRKIDRALEESLSIPIPEKMPKIVAIIDEFADLMMASSSDLETPIARIAQMARAVGIHLVLATQRPSREVITGLIKANFPTRIAFKVASRINSQIILDEVGAESLLGNGDMLFLPPGSSNLIRAQGSYISDEEINEIVDFICKQASPNYLIKSFDSMPREESDLTDSLESAKDSLYEQARAIVMETQIASTTYLQRKLKIGYARAASLMDELESKGVISPAEGAKPRKVLIGSGRPKQQEELFD